MLNLEIAAVNADYTMRVIISDDSMIDDLQGLRPTIIFQ